VRRNECAGPLVWHCGRIRTHRRTPVAVRQNPVRAMTNRYQFWVVGGDDITRAQGNNIVLGRQRLCDLRDAGTQTLVNARYCTGRNFSTQRRPATVGDEHLIRNGPTARSDPRGGAHDMITAMSAKPTVPAERDQSWVSVTLCGILEPKKATFDAESSTSYRHSLWRPPM